MNASDATIVVVPRDHFSDARESLESVLAHTPPSCPIVYVDGGSPAPVARYLRETAQRGRIELLRVDDYLTPNQARNLGAQRVKTPYAVFVDNDVTVAEGWLPPLVDCADATGAAVVGPLNFESRPPFEIVHFAGGDVGVDDTPRDGQARRSLIDRIHKLRIPEGPARTDVAEFHCMLVRMTAFRKVGGLDENLLSTRENTDFCLMLKEAGETVYLEPRSRINYFPPEPLALSDVPYFALRWSDRFDLSSFYYLRDKWRLDEDAYFERQYRNVGWRRREIMMRNSLLRWLVSPRLRAFAEGMLRPVERWLSDGLARRYARRHGIRLHERRA